MTDVIETLAELDAVGAELARMEAAGVSGGFNVREYGAKALAWRDQAANVRELFGPLGRLVVAAKEYVEAADAFNGLEEDRDWERFTEADSRVDTAREALETRLRELRVL